MNFREEDWLPGDRDRQSVKGKPKPDESVSYKDRATYGHTWRHDKDWYEKVKPGESFYVTAFRIPVSDRGTSLHLSEEPERLRLVRKKQARFSVIVSGQDDFWIEEAPHKHFVLIHNRRSGRKAVR